MRVPEGARTFIGPAIGQSFDHPSSQSLSERPHATASSPENVTAQNTLAVLFTQLGAAHAKCAVAPNEREAVRHWQNARQAYGRAREIYATLKANSRLSRADASKPDDLARELATCEANLRSVAAP